MKKMRIFVIIGLAVTVGIVSAVLLFNPAEEPLYVRQMKEYSRILEEGEPAYRTEEANSIVKKVMPLIEKATGKIFKEIPKVKLVSRKEIPRILERNRLPKLGRQRNTDRNRAMGSAEKHRNIREAVTLGFYGKVDKVLYLCPRNVNPVFRLYGIEETYVHPIIILTIVHELVHALQDQEVDLDTKFSRCTGTEESTAFRTTLEGHAVFIEELVARQLNFHHVIPLTLKLYKGAPLLFKEPVVQMLYNRDTLRTEQIYLKGRAFIEYHYSKGGSKRLWEILANPPIATSMIMEPETYSPVRLNSFDYSKILELEELDSFKKRNVTLAGETLQFVNVENGKFDLYVALAEVEPKKREDMISNVRHFQTCIVKYKGRRIGAVSFFLMKNTEYGSRFISATEELKKDYVEKMKSSTLNTVTDFSMDNFDKIDADVSRKMSYTWKPAEGESKKYRFVRISRGNVVLEIEDSLISFEDSEIVTLAETIFDHYEAAQKRHDLETNG